MTDPLSDGIFGLVDWRTREMCSFADPRDFCENCDCGADKFFSTLDALTARIAQLEAERDELKAANDLDYHLMLGQAQKLNAAEAENAKLREALERIDASGNRTLTQQRDRYAAALRQIAHAENGSELNFYERIARAALDHWDGHTTDEKYARLSALEPVTEGE